MTRSGPSAEVAAGSVASAARRGARAGGRRGGGGVRDSLDHHLADDDVGLGERRDVLEGQRRAVLAKKAGDRGVLVAHAPEPGVIDAGEDGTARRHERIWRWEGGERAKRRRRERGIPT